MRDTRDKQLPVDKALAMLLLSIDRELSAKVLRNFSDDTVDKVTRAMQELQEMAVDPVVLCSGLERVQSDSVTGAEIICHRLWRRDAVKKLTSSALAPAFYAQCQHAPPRPRSLSLVCCPAAAAPQQARKRAGGFPSLL